MPRGIYTRRPRPIADRFWSHVQKPDDAVGCWMWTGSTSNGGYGAFFPAEDEAVGAHRFAYELVKGPIPEGRQLDHLCRNRLCVNPDHVEPVTQHENLLRGEGFAGINSRATHCPKGHPYSGENLYVRPDRPGRGCKECKRESVRKWMRRQHEMGLTRRGTPLKNRGENSSRSGD